MGCHIPHGIPQTQVSVMTLLWVSVSRVFGSSASWKFESFLSSNLSGSWGSTGAIPITISYSCGGVLEVDLGVVDADLWRFASFSSSSASDGLSSAPIWSKSLGKGRSCIDGRLAGLLCLRLPPNAGWFWLWSVMSVAIYVTLCWAIEASTLASGLDCLEVCAKFRPLSSQSSGPSIGSINYSLEVLACQSPQFPARINRRNFSVTHQNLLFSLKTHEKSEKRRQLQDHHQSTLKRTHIHLQKKTTDQNTVERPKNLLWRHKNKKIKKGKKHILHTIQKIQKKTQQKTKFKKNPPKKQNAQKIEDFNKKIQRPTAIFSDLRSLKNICERLGLPFFF